MKRKQFWLIPWLVLCVCLCGLSVRGDLTRMVDEADEQTQKNVQKAREYGLQAAEYDAKGSFKAAAKQYLKQSKYEVTRDRRAQALRMAGDAFYAANCPEDALKTYKKLLETYPVYVPHSHVLTRLRYIAEKFVRGDGTFLGITDISLAIESYELVIREAPAEINTLSDRFRLAQLMCRKERYEEAIGVYQAIIQNDHRNWNARAELALLLWKLSAKSDGDGSKVRAAMRETQLVLRYDPQNLYARELKLLSEQGRELVARRIYDLGLFYLRAPHRRKEAAWRYLNEVVTEYPDTHAALLAKDALATHPLLKSAAPVESH